MSFRKRNVGLSSTQQGSDNINSVPQEKVHLPGVRPSAIDGRPTTSTGSATLDGLFAGHAGLPLGCNITILESGTTDYAGALLRFYAAEGLVQGHHVHVIGLPEQWGRELPGVVGSTEKSESKGQVSEKMKIAWRYERLGQFGADTASRERSLKKPATDPGDIQKDSSTFCHTFDLTKRLVHPASTQINFLMVDTHPVKSPFDAVLGKLSSYLTASPSNTVHRVVVPSLLSPAIYPLHSAMPQSVLTFEHGLRALLAAFPGRLSVMKSMPLSIFPRSSGLTRWLELLADGVFELAPFPHSADADFEATRDPSTREEPPQGLLKVHKIPIFHDRGVGQVADVDDWTFTLSRRKFTIKPFNLPPIDGDTQAQEAGPERGSHKKADLEF